MSPKKVCHCRYLTSDIKAGDKCLYEERLLSPAFYFCPVIDFSEVLLRLIPSIEKRYSRCPQHVEWFRQTYLR